jgi:polyhydroxybutyrate depolymerase
MPLRLHLAIICLGLWALHVTGSCGLFSGLTPGVLQNRTLQVGGIARRYLLYTPASIVADTNLPRPIWLNFHGNPDTAEEFWKYTQLAAKAEAKGFFSIYPQGLDVYNGDPLLDGPSWNSEGCCGQPSSGAADDKAFVLAIVNEITSAGCVDASKVWASGLSAGGYFAAFLACVASDVFSAVAIVAGLSGVDPANRTACPYARAIPVLALHSLGDVQVSYTGGVPGCTARNPDSSLCKEKSDEFMGIERLVGTYAQREGCASSVSQVFTNSTATVGAVVCKAHSGCPAGHSAMLCSIDDDVHAWPGAAEVLGESHGEKGTDNLDANEAVYNFFMTGSVSLAPTSGNPTVVPTHAPTTGVPTAPTGELTPGPSTAMKSLAPTSAAPRSAQRTGTSASPTVLNATVLNAVRTEDYRVYWATCIVICVAACAGMAWYLFVYMARVERERKMLAMFQRQQSTHRHAVKRSAHGVC